MYTTKSYLSLRIMLSLSVIFVLSFFNIVCAQSLLKPGFDKEEYFELLKVSASQGDSVLKDDRIAPKKFKMVYRSPEMGFANRWDLWVSDDTLACISIRGTTNDPVSWLDNFYAAMVPAKDTLRISNDFVFDYNLSDHPDAAVHTGWLISTAFLSRDILPKIDSLYKAGYKDFYIMGHSQGGVIATLLTAYVLKLKEAEKIPRDITIKSYCSAAPKAGNLFFAYDYENMTKGGWSLTVINATDWVPQTPFSIQAVTDFNKLNPFTDVKGSLRIQPLFKRIVLNHAYSKMDNATQDANDTFRKYLGTSLEALVKKTLPEFVSPVYANTSDYVRTGQQIVLYPDSAYFEMFPQVDSSIWINHSFKAYVYLTKIY